MELPNDFSEFLKEIRPTQAMLTNCKDGHTLLRDRLNSEKSLKEYLVSDFLQGSYRRSTAVRPKNGKRSDVDIIVVTNLSEEKYTPKKAMALFEPFLEKYYKGKWRTQGRSLGIELTEVDLDLVITSAPSESDVESLKSEAVTTSDSISNAPDWKLTPSWLSLRSREFNFSAKTLLELSAKEAEWKLAPLRIPDRDAGIWEDTHPLEQIRVTRDLNQDTNYHFVNVVKSIKWWWLDQLEDPQPPKGFPLERLIGECCPPDITSVAEGITRTLETVLSLYGSLILSRSKPVLPDYGVPNHDVFKRITPEQFTAFYGLVQPAALLAREALNSKGRTESGNLWRELLGNKFPKPPDNGGSNGQGYTPPNEPAVPGTSRYA
ncbi:MAG: nucleotidyltransferase [Anaerolinea sp.]|nr:nucleotidyltransferase [Anaerolinea sp.]